MSYPEVVQIQDGSKLPVEQMLSHSVSTFTYWYFSTPEDHKYHIAISSQPFVSGQVRAIAESYRHTVSTQVASGQRTTAKLTFVIAGALPARRALFSHLPPAEGHAGAEEQGGE